MEGLDKQGFAPGGLYHGQTAFGSKGPHKVSGLEAPVMVIKAKTAAERSIIQQVH